MIPNTLRQKYEAMDKEFCFVWGKYVQLHKDLDAYRGIEINADNIDAINKIISDLQDTWSDMFCVINFVQERATMCAVALRDHGQFMNYLKYSGAKPEQEFKNRAEEIKSDLIIEA